MFCFAPQGYSDTQIVGRRYLKNDKIKAGDMAGSYDLFGELWIAHKNCAPPLGSIETDFYKDPESAGGK